MQMDRKASSKHASVFLAVQGRLWYSAGKPRRCCLAALVKEEAIGPKALVAAPPPEEFHLCWKPRADLGAAERWRPTCGFHVM